jgi:hypothetical protein
MAAAREQGATRALRSSHMRRTASKERGVMAVAELSGNDNSPKARECLRHLVQAREGAGMGAGKQQRAATRLVVSYGVLGF